MSKGICPTIDNGLDKAWGIQTKAYLPKLERYFWGNHLKNCLSYEAETKNMFKHGVYLNKTLHVKDIYWFRKVEHRKTEVSKKVKQILFGLSSQGRACYEVRVLEDCGRGQRVKLCLKHQAIHCTISYEF